MSAKIFFQLFSLKVWQSNRWWRQKWSSHGVSNNRGTFSPLLFDELVFPSSSIIVSPPPHEHFPISSISQGSLALGTCPGSVRGRSSYFAFPLFRWKKIALPKKKRRRKREGGGSRWGDLSSPGKGQFSVSAASRKKRKEGRRIKTKEDFCVKNPFGSKIWRRVSSH